MSSAKLRNGASSQNHLFDSCMRRKEGLQLAWFNRSPVVGGAEPPKMYTCGHPRVSTGKDTCSWTIEPTRGAPGRSVVHPIDDPVAHACFRGLCAPHVQIMTSIMTIVHVGGQHLGIDPRKHPCRPQSGRRRLRGIHQTIRTWRMKPAAASARWSCVCRCLRRLQAPHVYSTSSYSSKRYTWN